MSAANEFDELPDELVLEIFNHFACVQSYEPQSVAFKRREEEKARQRDNREKQLALYALCLTSHRTRAIATPILYSSFVSCTTLYSLKPLQLFNRTICSSEPAPGLNVRFADCVQYIENRLSDYLGNSLRADIADVKGEEGLLMVSKYFTLLAEVVAHAPNLQHLNIVSIELDDDSFWEYLLPAESDHAPAAIATHGFRKLQSLSMQLQSRNYGSSHTEAPLFRNIYSALASVPELRDLRALGVLGALPAPPLFSTFEMLERFEITDCGMDPAEIAIILAACKSLCYITCHWAYVDVSTASCSQLYSGLLQHVKSLQSLRLDMRAVRVEGLTPKLGSLQSFISLESLCVDGPAIGFQHQLVGGDAVQHALDYRMSSLLPRNLERLNILMHSAFGSVLPVLDDIRALLDVAVDVPSSLPRLRTVNVLCPGGFREERPEVANAFSDVGVHFSMVDESTQQSRG
jgi:hypothetical protein